MQFLKLLAFRTKLLPFEQFTLASLVMKSTVDCEFGLSKYSCSNQGCKYNIMPHCLVLIDRGQIS